MKQFEIAAELGRGGMGEVYRAVDTELGREVAIKVLPAAFSENPERLARFEREARVLASLDHPNIASIYEVGEDAGVRFLAMQLVQGEDLAERLRRGPMSVDEAVSVSTQIAYALEAAHDRGVVHRDVKPANVRLASSGEVKVLDFGLATSVRVDGVDDSSPTQAPTMSVGVTRAGAVLGTTAYMSPEQARGQAVDARSDVWAFGCVLWECLTGASPFAAPTVSDCIGSILRAEPDWDRLPLDTPINVERLLRRCLSKDPRQRLHAIADARIELEDPDRASVDPPTPRPRFRVAELLGAAVIGLLIGSIVTHQTVDRSRPDIENPLAGARFTKVTDWPGAEFDAAISPDGRFVAFVSDRDGPFEVLVGQVGSGNFRNPVPAGEGSVLDDARAPVRSVGFNADGAEIWFGGGPWRRLRSMPLLGGPLQPLLGEEAVSVAWSPDGSRLVYHDRLPGDPLYVADRRGTSPRKIAEPSAGIHQHYPIWSVDGRWIYFVRGRPATLEMDLWRVSADGGEAERLTQGLLDVRYPAPIDETTVLYSAREANGAGPWLWALDVSSGTSRRASLGLEQYASVASTADGRRLVATVRDARASLWSVPILDRVATELDAERLTGLSTTRALAPRFRGSSLYFLSSRGGGDGLWQLSDDGRVSEIWKGRDTALLEPVEISPDGESVAVVLQRGNVRRLHTLNVDGTRLELVSELVDARGAPTWSPDGRWIVTGGNVGEESGLYRVPVGRDAPERLVEGEALNPVWSPRGDLIVYTGAQVNVYSPLLAVRPDGESVVLPEIQVFRFGQRARFLPDGSGLVYMQGASPEQDFWLLDLETMATRQLTELDPTDAMQTFDITPDGRRIVFDRLNEDSDVVLIERRPRD